MTPEIHRTLNEVSCGVQQCGYTTNIATLVSTIFGQRQADLNCTTGDLPITFIHI